MPLENQFLGTVGALVAKFQTRTLGSTKSVENPVKRELVLSLKKIPHQHRTKREPTANHKTHSHPPCQPPRNLAISGTLPRELRAVV